MSDPREHLHDRLQQGISLFADENVFDAVPGDDEIAAAIDAYADEVALEERFEGLGETYLAADIMIRLLERRGIVLRHASEWAGEGADLGAVDGPGGDVRENLEDLQAAGDRYAPASYDELLGRYIGLAGDVLEGTEYEVEGTDDTVRVVCERDGRQFEATADAGTVDVAPVLSLLNRVVEETTLDDHRFVRIDPLVGSDVDVFFVEERAVYTLENYFTYAREVLQRKAEGEETLGERD